MGARLKTYQDGDSLTIRLTERFDFSVHKEFRNAYRSLESQPAKYIVDLSEVAYMDSSALGMLLLLHEHAGEVGAGMHIVGVSPSVEEVLRIANLHTLFSIESAADHATDRATA